MTNQCTLIKDKKYSGTFRVERIDEDGGCEVSVFSGPNAVERAIYFAAGYYDKCKYSGFVDDVTHDHEYSHSP